MFYFDCFFRWDAEEQGHGREGCRIDDGGANEQAGEASPGCIAVEHDGDDDAEEDGDGVQRDIIVPDARQTQD